MGKKTIIDTFLDTIVVLDDDKKIANTFKTFLKKAKTTEEKIELSACYKRFLKKTGLKTPEPSDASVSEAISLEDVMKKREEVTESIKLFNDGKSFNINQFNNFFENLKVGQGSQRSVNELQHVDFNDPFGNCQPIVEYGGIIVEDTSEINGLDRDEYGMFELSNLKTGNIEKFKNTKTQQFYTRSGETINQIQHRNAEEYVKFKKDKLHQEMEIKKQKVIDRVKNGYYQGDPSLIERQLNGYNHHELVDKLAHGAFKK